MGNQYIYIYNMKEILKNEIEVKHLDESKYLRTAFLSTVRNHF